MLNYTIRNKQDGSSELIIFNGCLDMEGGTIEVEEKRRHRISRVRLVLASGIVVAMSFTQLAQAVNQGERGTPLALAMFSSTDVSSMSAYVRRASKPLSMVFPQYFTLDDQGTVGYGTVTSAFSHQMSQQGVDVLGVVTYDGPFTPNVLSQGTYIGQQLAELCQQYALKGVTINLPYAGGQEYTEFLEEVAAQLGQYTLSAAIYPARHSYQYASLNQVCQYVLVNPLARRAQSYISPHYSAADTKKQVEKVIKGGVAQNKTIISLDLGGRIWGSGWDGSIPIDPQKVGEITRDFAIKESYDSQTGATYVDFTIKPGQKYYIGSQRLYPGDYTINMGSGTYAREVLMLAGSMGVKGVTLLQAPLAPADLWEYFHLWLGTGYFEDIATTFGRDEIMKTYIDGVMEGVSPGRFAPYQPITRGEAAALTTRLMKLPESSRNTPFTDIQDHWAAKYINSAYWAGHMIGDRDGYFRPDDRLTREEAAVLVARLSGIDERHREGYVFSDVPPDSWSGDSIIALHNAGIINGYGDGTFRPKNNMTREEIAMLVSRLEKFL